MSDIFDLSEIASVSKPRKATEKSTWIFYSPPGVGKTLLAGSAAEVESMSPVVMLDFEGGAVTLEGHYDDVDVIKIDNWETGAAVIEALVHNQTKYKTVIFDSLGSAQDCIKEWHERTTSDNNGFAVWAAVRDKLVSSFKALHMTDYNVIATAHAERDTDEFSRQRTVRPHFLGRKSHVDIPKISDFIGYLFIQEDDKGNKRRVLQFEADENVVTKNRAGGRLPDYVTDPTFKKLHEALNAE